MKYINQLEHKDIPYITKTDTPEEPRGKETTFSSSGCGLASAIMVADRLLIDPELTLEDAVQLSYSCGANHATGTDYKIFAPVFAEKFGLKLEVSEDPERLRYCLRTGGAAVIYCSVGDGYAAVFTKGGHYVVAICEAEDGRIVILDPSYTDTKFDTPERRDKVEIRPAGKRNVVLCDIQVLVEDTMAVKPECFYLFWRK